ncbi:type 4a pilus biogenesis protein PilO [Candidatus Berkelbacteria bacterium]|nr:type 4a pilus biogenesis protein PilO [Candidatus Berkelbacteria bacterium]
MKIAFAQRIGSMVVAAAMVLSGFAVWLIMAPALQRIGATQAEIVQLNTEVTDLQQQVAALRSFARQGDALKQQLSILAIAAPAKGKIPELLIMIQTMAGRSGLTLLNATPAVSGGNTRTDITLRGDYPGLVNFFDALNHNIRPGIVKSFSFIGQGTADAAQNQSVMDIIVEFIGGGTGNTAAAKGAQ